ncbi:hypothetical protein ETAA8_08510 [Anatilimnocola aggregata]|uniref:Uncharacterized protein n=1 Tax=Anatilimnocola aggregata TaxID=2528021 RepID=A0A517Y6D1_9BACT|nr:hypothetical protein [Anatilimnocola aggregata]QDU25780.1 hypothetical protein ETAA8_08510 [Anatilimnocola aggregata]
MSPKPVPPLPPSPDFGDKPRTSYWSLVLVGIALLLCMTLLTFLTLGLFGPVILLGFVVFVVIGLQYLLWGWLFERVYRQGRDQSDD